MSAMTFHGKVETLEIIQEKQPNLARLKHSGLDIVRSMQIQSWSGYYAMLNGPVYPVLVKEFWKYARISDDGNTVMSEVYRLPIAISISSIEKAINRVSSGVTIDDFQTDLSIVERCRILFDDSITFEPNNPEKLRPSARTWFRFSLTNLRPRATARSTMCQDDRIFVFLLTHHFKINVPKTIFNHLKHSIEVSRTQIQSYIPYGRMISEIMIREGFWGLLSSVGPAHSVIEERCARVDSVEDFDD